MSSLLLSEKQVSDFHRDGFVIAKGFYTVEEISKLQQKAFNDDSLYEKAWDKKDASGTISKVCLWQELGSDLYSMFSRGRRLTDSVEKLLGEPVFHTTTKIMMKEPYVGGAWEWHQDFGYWHHDNFHLMPKLVSVMIAINKATIANGCLEVLKGSHHLGRLNHSRTGDQKGAEMLFVNEALKHLELVKVELEPGDALFFHCNLLHKSNQNRSSDPRWTMISAYCAESAKPFHENSLQYRPLVKVDDDAILRHGN
ncbi:phytanoyl-CoA dioxygenase family protein [Paraferrimonas haliotis]|uniref:L-proline 4-hydroxylase n=1 Tax=Paraferrimonas haliotis TaxID=2013866 RepID=A0AA37TSD8_9GAMM|nr:phytanoyl-CoA dioxygenase family protein [Paraferrimonas haliotis]GLS84585.1 L-proline 4-hydroxylase [Paraferrimonas haliotis]